jgi:hypothetical protein
LDREAKSGSIDIAVSVNSIDFGMAKMDEHAKSPDLFDAAKYPTATYSGKFTKFNGTAPTEAQGTLTLHGVTKPVTLVINSFKPKAAGKRVTAIDDSMVEIPSEPENCPTRAKLDGNSGGQVLPDLFPLDIAGSPRESVTAASQWQRLMAHQRLGH